MLQSTHLIKTRLRSGSALGRDAPFVEQRRPSRRSRAVPLVGAPALTPASSILQLQRVTALRRCGIAGSLLTTRNSPGELSFGRRDKSAADIMYRAAAKPSERSIVRTNEGDL